MSGLAGAPLVRRRPVFSWARRACALLARARETTSDTFATPAEPVPGNY